MTCLITGCYLHRPEVGAAWGDLHKVGDCFVFNAVLDEKGETRLMTQSQLPARGDKGLYVREGADVFERRGVIIVPCNQAHLNLAAERYVRGEKP
jgi:hypothetical protein